MLLSFAVFLQVLTSDFDVMVNSSKNCGCWTLFLLCLLKLTQLLGMTLPVITGKENCAWNHFFPLLTHNGHESLDSVRVRILVSRVKWQSAGSWTRMAAVVNYSPPWWVNLLHRLPHFNMEFQIVSSDFRPEDSEYQKVGQLRGNNYLLSRICQPQLPIL